MNQQNRAQRGNHVDSATTLVATRKLEEQGFDKIRILSHSKFADMVNNLVQDARPTPAAEAESNEVVSQAYQMKWHELRTQHQDKLLRLESGMRRLSTTFAQIQSAMYKLENDTSAKPPAAASTMAAEATSAPTAEAVPTAPKLESSRGTTVAEAAAEVVASRANTEENRPARPEPKPAPAKVPSQQALLREMLL